ncbi:tetratricopeptide repeat protein 4 [Danaus plexippus plexippus]|uniref:Tetratricopeptide repeat protein 4 n=1 Tax=Danaus plexippus plexippus TaxID=278856 RepID=A0A212F1P4_DANPL|nr:tetratricopeptide repeat protein 4 [Danaus plexippus plexippus]
MTEEERIALCQKLDKELNDFIDGLEKKRYTEGWPEDRWEEEMDKHPFFMKSTPEDGELSPLAEGLAKLKYDPEENTPLELATNYKEDGNFNFKHKNYRLAIIGYTEGIKVRCDNAEINASLYNNRAAAHFHLKNYRSALYDSEKALSFNPGHEKSRLRAAKSALQISRFDTCIEHCQQLLEQKSSDKELSELMADAKKKKMVVARDERKKKKVEAKRSEQKDLVVKAVIQRGIKISKCEDEDDIDLSKLEPTLPGAQESIVHLENGILKWPVLFLYPEYQTSDFVKACPEDVPLIRQLEQLFPAPWDEAKTYNVRSINVYYEGSDKMPHVVDPKKNLGELLVAKYYELKAGTPAFFVMVRGSRAESRFIECYLYQEDVQVTSRKAEKYACLYSNRAAEHWNLRNFKQALYDSEKALLLNPEDDETRLRAAKSALEAAKYDASIEHCRKLIQKNCTDIELFELLAIAKMRKKEAKTDESSELIVKAVLERGIKISKCKNKNDIDISKLEPTLPGARDSMVYLENGVLKWPILFLYPEYETSDFLTGCPENVPLIYQLEKLFPAPWDRGNKYCSANIKVYYEGCDKMPHIVDPRRSLGELLVSTYYELKAGTPMFFVMVRGSWVESMFLDCYL